MYVTEGEFEVEIDGKTSRLSGGDTLYVPVGVVRSGGNVGQETAKRLVMFIPGHVEGLFLKLGAPSAEAELDTGAAIACASLVWVGFQTTR